VGTNPFEINELPFLACVSFARIFGKIIQSRYILFLLPWYIAPIPCYWHIFKPKRGVRELYTVKYGKKFPEYRLKVRTFKKKSL